MPHAASNVFRFAIIGIVSFAALAQERAPIRILVGFPPGGGTDAITRFVVERLPEHLANLSSSRIVWGWGAARPLKRYPPPRPTG